MAGSAPKRAREHAPAPARSTLPLAPPAGMRDLLPPDASARKRLARAVSDSFARYGYELVTTPMFEHADVIERGLDTVDRRELLRFVDSDTGEIALLRPDITPQIARVVATRLADRPPPYRLAYEGSVFRRRRGRARRQRQIAQAGVECIGLSGPGADVEVIELASRTLEALGLVAHRIELGLSPVARTVLTTVPEALRGEAADALSRKDRSALEVLAERAGLRGRARATLVEMVDLWGGREVLDAARKLFPGRDAAARLDALADVHAQLVARGLRDRLVLDLGEVRGFGYYTGPSFTLLAEGPGEALGGGGRYDDLLARFGAPFPATGFGLDLDHLEWALASAGARIEDAGPVRVAMRGVDPRKLADVADALRSAGLVVAALPESDDDDAALAFARAWGYDVVVSVSARAASARRVRDGATRKIALGQSGRGVAADEASAIERWARETRG
ncbi:ATP phosphoribosyltransferase regulatory subunit [Sandaracinus amylolyticus]|uniref:ATP phosphoribosyltransferase regulatory subunit n=1 Tax=Sandaracinus amylolyticus TaxID=927083 RepID=UPI00069DFD9C|nr:ATP phosphoribosyltransferase regulatory subunit [Sandaracinus amylolyticus]